MSRRSCSGETLAPYLANSGVPGRLGVSAFCDMSSLITCSACLHLRPRKISAGESGLRGASVSLNFCTWVLQPASGDGK